MRSLAAFLVLAATACAGDRVALERKLAEIVAQQEVPGAVVALVRRGREPWIRSFGHRDRDRRLPMRPDTLFRVGSITKSFTAMAVVRLTKEGKLDLQAKVLDLAPELGIVNPWEETDPLRVVHLLEHTSGLPDFHFPELFDYSGVADPPLEDQLSEDPRWLRLRWRPGERWAYTNRAFVVAAHLMEKVTGRGWREVVRSRVFEPAGLTGATYVRTPAAAERLAEGYLDASGPPAPYYPTYFRPAANLMLSVEDLARWVGLMLRDGEGLLERGLLKELWSPHSTAAAGVGHRVGWGMGLVSRGNRDRFTVGHYGGGYAFQLSYRFLPEEGVGWVVALNASYRRRAFHKLQDALYEELTSDLPPPPEPYREDLPDGLAERMVGYYGPVNVRHEVLAFWIRRFDGRSVVPHGGGLALERFDPRRLSTRRQELEYAGYLSGGRGGHAFRVKGECRPSLVFQEEPDGSARLVGDTIHAVRDEGPLRDLGGKFLVFAFLGALVGAFGVAFWTLAWLLGKGEDFHRPWRASTMAASVLLIGTLALAAGTPPHELGLPTPRALWICWAGYLYVALVATGWADFLRDRLRRGHVTWVLGAVLCCHAFLVLYLGSYGLLGIRLWAD